MPEAILWYSNACGLKWSISDDLEAELTLIKFAEPAPVAPPPVKLEILAVANVLTSESSPVIKEGDDVVLNAVIEADGTGRVPSFLSVTWFHNVRNQSFPHSVTQNYNS